MLLVPTNIRVKTIMCFIVFQNYFQYDYSDRKFYNYRKKYNFWTQFESRDCVQCVPNITCGVTVKAASIDGFTWVACKHHSSLFSVR